MLTSEPEYKISEEVKKTAEHIRIISQGAIQALVDREKEEAYKEGYNQCLKDRGLTGARWQHFYL